MKEDIRKEVLALGVDVCGFAEIERFDQAPQGFHPCDIYKDCKSVVVIGIAIPKGLFEVKPDFVYGHFNYETCHKMDTLLLMAAKIIEDTYGGIAVPIPCDSPYEYWDSKKMEGRGLISMRHAAINAGIGALGKNTLLMNKKYGNRLILGAILTNLELPSDNYSEAICIKGCNLCMHSCPAQALNGEAPVQKLCRENTFETTERGFDIVKCNKCRSICPMRFGSEPTEIATIQSIFPEPILKLPEADIPFKGCRAYISQGKGHQILFMHFDEDVELPEHYHESQWAIVLEGRIDITMDGTKNTYRKNDRYYIPKGSKHSGKIFAGYADITYFNQENRYSLKHV